MFKVSGSLSIRTINGRNGDFNVGRLVTEIGEFSIKDTVLDQYDEGKYEGEFGISRIYPSHYLAGNRLVVEIRANLESVALIGIDKLDEDPAMVIVKPEPADDGVKAAPQAGPELQPEPEAEPDDAQDPDVCLFGALWPLEDKVKLDPTVDRGLFRRQRNRLKELGYTFQAVGQIWVKADHGQQSAA